MTEQEKKACERLLKRLESMPERKRWNFLYFAEGFVRRDENDQERVIHE